MTTRVSLLALLSLALLLLSGCFGPKTPQEVTEAFWEAVVANDAEEAVKYSTLTTVDSFDGFSKDWQGYAPTWGRVVIDNDQASVVADFINPDSSGDNTRRVVTYLVRRGDAWVVDYARTAQSVRGSVVEQLFGRLESLQDELAIQFDASSREFEAEMERLNAEAEALADSISRQAEATLEEYGEALQETIKSLEESIERALSDKKGELSDHDRRVLQEVSHDLEDSRETLDREAGLEEIVASSQTVAVSRARLETTDGEVVGAYQDEWREWAETFRQQMEAMLDELSGTRT